MSDNNEQKAPYSHHTFLFPFRWDLPETDNRQDFERELRRRLDESWWQETGNETEAIAPGAERDRRYATYQYLTGPARRLAFSAKKNEGSADTPPSCPNKIFFSTKKNEESGDAARAIPAWHFALRPQASDADKKKRKYRIEKSSANQAESFELDIRAIRLHVYNTGVAVLIFELEYWGVKYATEGSGHRFDYQTVKPVAIPVTLADINKINEHGRRVNLPFIAPLPNRLTADRIILELEDGQCFGDDFRVNGKEFRLNHVMKPIRKLLGLNAKVKPVTDKNALDDGHYLITPAIDDRMYVVCLCHNDELIKKARIFSGGEYAYLTDWECAAELYTFAFIENDCTCQSQTMIFELLRQTVYNRWIKYGTVYAATHHSLVCLTTSKAPEAAVIKPFLNIYTEMAIIALAQRATILALSDDAAKIANKYKPDQRCGQELRNEIARLRDRHIRAQNQILLDEVTVQEQGEELFPMIQNGLFIGRSNDKLGGQLENLYAIAADSYERGQEDFERNIKKLALLLAALVLPAFLETLGVCSLLFRWLLTVPIVAGLWFWFISDKYKRYRKCLSEKCTKIWRKLSGGGHSS